MEYGGQQLLAAAVIRLAVIDLQSPAPWRGAEARAFLDDSDGLRFWCRVADLEPRTVRLHAARECTKERRHDQNTLLQLAGSRAH